MEWQYTPPSPLDLNLPHKTWRTGQREGVEQIVKLWTEGVKVVMMNGPTGAGKSIVSLAAATIYSNLQDAALDCTVLTQTKDLQKQYTDEIEACASATGRSNWPCGLSFHFRASQCERIGTKEVCTTLCPYKVQRDNALASSIRAINYSFYGATSDLFHASIMIADEADYLGELLVESKSVDLSNLIESYGLQVPQGFVNTEDMAETLQTLQEGAATPEEREEAKRGLTLLKTKRYAIKGIGNSIVPWPESRVIQDFCKQPTLIMSATCFAPEFWSKEWNVPVGWVELPSLSPATNRPIYLENVKRINKNTTEDEWLEVIDAIDNIIQDRVESKGLIHSVSNWLTDLILEHSRYRHLMYKAAGPTRLEGINQFTAADNGVLIGPQLLRGLNLADDLCRFIIFPKIPYPSLADPRIQEMMKGGDDRYRIETLSAVIQGVGRGVRGPADHCETFILDSGAGWLFKATKNWLPGWFAEAIQWK